MCLKLLDEWVANIVYHDLTDAPFSGLHCLLKVVPLNTQGKYGTWHQFTYAIRSIITFIALERTISQSKTGLDTSNEYPQHMFLWRNKKNINTFELKEVPQLVLCTDIFLTPSQKHMFCVLTWIASTRQTYDYSQYVFVEKQETNLSGYFHIQSYELVGVFTYQ